MVTFNNKIKEKIPHSLSQKRITSCFTDDQVSPLYNDNSNEKRSLASVLKTLSISVSLEKNMFHYMFHLLQTDHPDSA